MKSVRFFIINFLIIFFIFSCPRPNGWAPPQYFEYKPNKAAAEITKRISVPKGVYLTYTNNHYYLLDSNRILIFDLSDDEINVDRTIDFDIKKLYTDEFYNCCGFGIMDDNEKIIFGLGFNNSQYYNYYNQYFNRFIFSVDYDGENLCYVDISSDIQDYKIKESSLSSFPLRNFWYDNESKILYAGLESTHNDEEGIFRIKHSVYQYKYNSENNKYENKGLLFYVDENYLFDMFISKNNLVTMYYEEVPSGWINNVLKIYYEADISSEKIVIPQYLGLKNIPLSAFFDSDGNIWLYINKDEDNYEMVKIKPIQPAKDCSDCEDRYYCW